MPVEHFSALRRKEPLTDEPDICSRLDSGRTGRWRTRLLIGGVVALPLGAAFGYLARLDPETFRSAKPVAAVPKMSVVLGVRQVDATVMAGNAPVFHSQDAPLASTKGLTLPPPPPPLPPLRRQTTVAPRPVLEADRIMPETRPSFPSIQDVEPSFDCASAQSWAEQMVCEEPELAAADRRLANAFDQAVAAGVTQRSLRGEHNDWLRSRDVAARESPWAVRQVYEQRIAELLAIAKGPE